MMHGASGRFPAPRQRGAQSPDVCRPQDRDPSRRPQRFRPQDVLGRRFVLKNHLSDGGFGSVWRATDIVKNRTVVVKVLHETYERNSWAVRMFRQEADLLFGFRHGSIVRVLDRARPFGPYFFPLEYVNGETLRAYIRRRAEAGAHTPLTAAVWICRQTASALAYAHRKGVIHADLKPANVMVSLSRPLSLKLLDFGASQVFTTTPSAADVGARRVGSLAYLTPEVILKKPLCHRADQFGLATVMYEVLTLRRAWSGPFCDQARPRHKAQMPAHESMAIMQRIVSGERPTLRSVRKDLPPAVEQVLHKAMAIHPIHRFESITAFADAFQTAASGESLLSVRSFRSQDGRARSETYARRMTCRPLATIRDATTVTHDLASIR